MLLSAAAEQLKVPVTELTTARSRVLHAASGKTLSYADLAESAARQPLPDDSAIVFKQPGDYTLLGRRVANVDNRAIVTGAPLFGSDTRLPGMLYATLVKCPAIGGRPRSANMDEIKALPGVVDAFIIEGTNDMMHSLSRGPTTSRFTTRSVTTSLQAWPSWPAPTGRP
jgi:isoquinoline 1-oxidoreductase beta subunit